MKIIVNIASVVSASACCCDTYGSLLLHNVVYYNVQVTSQPQLWIQERVQLILTF